MHDEIFPLVSTKMRGLAVHAHQVLQRWLTPALSVLDRRNTRNLLSAVEACLAGRKLVMMELARQWPGAIKVAAPLKRLDRLLGNARVHAARGQVYQAVLGLVLRSPEPVLVVDWSELKDDGRWHLLRAGIVVRGRTLTAYEEVHPQCLLGVHRVHKAFLARLKVLLPAHVRPIVITDAGFKVPWFREIERLGWRWLSRVRGHVGLRPVNQPLAPYRRIQTLYPRATTTPRALGAHELTAQHGHRCEVVLVRRPARQRHQCLQRSSARAGGGYAQKMARAGREPWLLACAPVLADRSPGQIMRLYARRMQIESAFRDLKSHRYGCGFEDTQTRSAERLEMLLLIHMLATLLAWMAALATTHEHEHRFRISVLRRGWEYLRQSRGRLPAMPERALDSLANTLQRASEVG